MRATRIPRRESGSMGQGGDTRPGRGPVTARRLRARRDGVASVVGTILSIMVITTLLSIAMGVWVPAMMKTREAGHNQDIYHDMLTLKANIDDQVARNSPGDERTTPLTLGFGDVPIFVAATSGGLRIDQSGGALLVEERNATASRQGAARVVFRSQNNFYIQQSIIYEAGGLLVYQDQGQVIRSAPPMTFSNDSGVRSAELTIVYLVTRNESLSGSGTVDIKTTLIDTSTEVYNWSGKLGGRNVYFNLTSQYQTAWLTYFNTTLARAGFDEGGTDPGDDINGDYDTESTGTTASIQIRNLHYLTIRRAIIQAELKV